MQLEIRSSPHTVVMGKVGKKLKQQFKVHATKSKDYLGGGNQH